MNETEKEVMCTLTEELKRIKEEDGDNCSLTFLISVYESRIKCGISILS